MNACNSVSQSLPRRGATQEVQGSLLPDNAPTEKLLNTLAGYNGAFEAVDAAMQDIVDILREREVSWATIRQALAVSRQAAWKWSLESRISAVLETCSGRRGRGQEGGKA
jgi:hypothetical protein